MPAPQNVLAVVYDFDQTLIPYFMQRVLFEKYHVNEKRFWDDNDTEIARVRERGINVEEEFAYMNTVLRYVEQGRFPGLSNQILKDLGKRLEFYPGLPDFLPRIKSEIEDDPRYQSAGITLEHYVISTGFGETIRGSAVGPYLNGVFGAEFSERDGIVHYIARAIGFMKKTQYLHLINKGANVNLSIGVNDVVPKEERRIPFENMIYVADGFTDIPCFATLNDRNGTSMSVYDPASPKALAQAKQLLADKRVISISPADYQPGSDFYQKVSFLLKEKANRVLWKKGN